MRRLVHPYGINVSSSHGSTDCTGLDGASAADPFSSVHSGSRFPITVADTGSGMTDDVAEHIFDPFFTTKEPGKGTGLGLHTVHTIIGRIGGDITVSSGPEGTTFTVTLPALTPS